MKDKNKNINEPEKQELSRELGLFQLTMMGAGMMIGAGVFVATGIAIGEAGTGGILLAFALNGLIAIFTAMSFAELCSAIPAAGGAYSYVKKAFGGLIGFISGWMNWFALAVAGSLYAITFSEYTLHMMEGFEFFEKLNLNMHIAVKSLAVLVALVFILINYKGVKDTGTSSTIIALGQTVTLLIIGAMGVFVAVREPERLLNFQPFLSSGKGAVLVAMGFTYVGFEGFEVIGHAGEEAIDPKKNIPKAILYAVIVVVTTYLMVAFAAVIGVHNQGVTVREWFEINGSTGFADSVKMLFPAGGMLLVTLAAIFSSTSALNATLFSSARVSFAISRDGFLPPSLTKISKTQVPSVALFFSSIIVLVVATLFPVEDVAAAADIMFLLIFMLINISVIRIRKTMGDELHYGYLMPFFPWVPILALILQLTLAIFIFQISPTAWLSAGAWIVAGIIFYFAYSKSHAKKRAQRSELEYIRAADKRKYRVMVPIRSGEISHALVKFAERLAWVWHGEMQLTRIMSIPHYATDEEAAMQFDFNKEYITEARQSITMDVPVSTIVARSDTAARGIVDSIRDHQTNMVVLGWKGYTEKQSYEMGNTLDRVIETAPCNIMIIKPGDEGLHTGKPIRRILMPTTGSQHATLAAKIAISLLDDSDESLLTIFNVNKQREPEQNIMRRLQPIITEMGNIPMKVKIVESDDIVGEILKESEKNDMLILGAPDEGALKTMLFGRVTERIASECPKTVILAKKDMGVRSWIRRWIGSRK
ncbi:MAG: amino acid permease [Clostridia bacterium]|nr:amino acid permease [Clostridia bacterium]